MSSFGPLVIRAFTQRPTRTLRTATRTVVCVLAFLTAASLGAATVPTFTRDVAPILFKNCVHCHRPGDIASHVPFLSYETVRPWAKAIKQEAALRQMPPWSADPNASVRFRNDPRLSRQVIDTLVAWVNGGAPKGDDTNLPPLPNSDGWLHPEGLKPDLVISMPGEFHAPAKGAIPYVRFFAKVPFLEDRWVVASQARPSNPAIVHHMAITEVELANGVTPEDLGPMALLARQLGLPSGLAGARPAVTVPSNPATFDMLGVYTPGTTFEMYPDDSAKLLRGGKNMYLDFNVHYQATGKPETDRSTIAFWFRKGPPKHQIFRVPAVGETIIANGKELLMDTPGVKAEGTRVAIPPIPPNDGKYELVSVTGFPEPVTIYQLQPHAHLRAKDFNYSIIFPDGREQSLLNVPKYDFRWQLAYELDAPLHLPAGSKMIVTAHYDNSLNNKYNPAADQPVYFRDQNQSWDEMFTPFVQYSLDNQDLTGPGRIEKPLESVARGTLEIAEVVGCLEQGPGSFWTLARASGPVTSTTQSTTSVAVKAAAVKPLGEHRYSLLGVAAFHPSDSLGGKVAIIGILIPRAGQTNINITSLQMVSKTCP
ncbi:MAG TPA: hypothetical protein VMH80_05610 [Bryobacteraceae bacterium]|nr:hypothetical protein [Bryobacteraceae bacterium]